MGMFKKPAPPPPPPVVEPEAPKSEPPKRVPWKAVAARPNNAPRRNRGEAYDLAHAAKTRNAPASHSASRLKPQNREPISSNSSNFTLSHFPGVPDVASPESTLNDKLRHLSRKMSFTKSTEEPGIDLSRPMEENEKVIPDMGLQQSRSMIELDRTPSPIKALQVLPRTGSGNSLGDNVGFNFKNTTNFIHPGKQTPRHLTPLSHSHVPSYHSGVSEGYEDEDYDDTEVERLNSVTSDGGWQSGWSMNGSQAGSFSEPSGGQGRRGSEAPSLARRPSVAPVYEDASDDEAERSQSEGANAAIAEEDDDVDEDNIIQSLFRGVQSEEPLTDCEDASRSSAEMDDRTPSQEISPVDSEFSVAPLSFAASKNASQSDLSIRSEKSNKSIDHSLEMITTTRSRSDTVKSGASASSSSPVRASLDKAFGIISRTNTSEPEDDAERAANIAAARRAFDEKEAAKDEKYAQLEAERVEREERRRKRTEAAQSVHSRIWRRESTARRASLVQESSRTSVALDTGRMSYAIDSAVDAEFDESLNNANPLMSNPPSMSRKPSAASIHAAMSRKPSSNSLHTVSRKESSARKSMTPRRTSTSSLRRRESRRGSATFEAYEEDPEEEEEAERQASVHSVQQAPQAQQAQQIQHPRVVSMAASLAASEPVESVPSGLWPPPSTGQVYNIGGKMYDEFGMSVATLVTTEEKGKSKGKFIRFSAWSKPKKARA